MDVPSFRINNFLLLFSFCKCISVSYLSEGSLSMRFMKRFFILLLQSSKLRVFIELVFSARVWLLNTSAFSSSIDWRGMDTYSAFLASLNSANICLASSAHDIWMESNMKMVDISFFVMVVSSSVYTTFIVCFYGINRFLFGIVSFEDVVFICLCSLFLLYVECAFIKIDK